MSAIELWSKSNIEGKSFSRHFPATYILRSLFSPRYFQNAREVQRDHKVLDIGCLYTNNLVPFWDRDCELHGLEVTDEAVEIARQSSDRQNMTVNLQVGLNRFIPFASEHFDFVLSINTIHYEETPNMVLAALQEMKRVLKPEGCLFIATLGQEDAFVSDAYRNGPNDYTVCAADDFRDGQRMCFFEGERNFRETLSTFYEDVETGMVTEKYPACTAQYMIGVCVK